MKIDENHYLKDRTVCKTVTIRIEEKTIVTLQSRINNQKAVMIMPMTTILVFQHMKIVAMFL